MALFFSFTCDQFFQFLSEKQKKPLPNKGRGYFAVPPCFKLTDQFALQRLTGRNRHFFHSVYTNRNRNPESNSGSEFIYTHCRMFSPMTSLSFSARYKLLFSFNVFLFILLFNCI